MTKEFIVTMRVKGKFFTRTVEAENKAEAAKIFRKYLIKKFMLDNETPVTTVTVEKKSRYS